MAVQERQTEQNLAFGRGAVAGGAPGDDVDDAEHGAVEVDAGEHFIEQLAGGAYEGEAGAVFLGTWGFADEHEVGLFGAVGEDQAGGGVAQGAAGEILEGSAEVFQRVAGGGDAGGVGWAGGERCGYRGWARFGGGGCWGGFRLEAVLGRFQQGLVGAPF